MRIVFMGTPDFARTILERLVADGREVVGVFTQPDKPRNRNKVTPSPVKEYAITENLPVFQPVTMRDGTALAELRALTPDIAVVAAYGRILPEEMLAVPPLGCINVHASLLPKYRGAAPINHAILNGDAETGVTIMHMAKACDTGDMILTRAQPIRPDETAEELFRELAVLGADALTEALSLIEAGSAPRTPQDEAAATYAKMLDRSLSPIDWTRSAWEIDCQVRGLIPWPCATTSVDGKTVKVYETERGGATDAPAGTMRAVKRGIAVACGDGESLVLTQLQAEGGKRMAAADYLRGHPLKTTD